jgi:hypothetical protein
MLDAMSEYPAPNKEECIEGIVGRLSNKYKKGRDWKSLVYDSADWCYEEERKRGIGSLTGWYVFGEKNCVERLERLLELVRSGMDMDGARLVCGWVSE